MDLFTPAQPKRTVFSVSRLNREVRGLLESNFGLLWIEAEISNFSAPASGHWYFSLKDDKAQVRCAMFKNRNRLVRNRPGNGDKVLVRARISVYEPRGEYQLLAEHIEPAGQGELQRRFDALKAQLESEGLFAPERKKPIPVFPQRIGVITSPTGAAIRDILSVLKRRNPMIPVTVYPVQVQGDGSAREIVMALKQAAQRNDCDVLILARGGGSLEDLWSFNEEAVARAIAECPVPLLCGVGHETDFTIADFVSDRRAPTPSVAAEMAAPELQQLVQKLQRAEQSLNQKLRNKLDEQQTQLTYLEKRLQLQHPRHQLQQQAQKLDDLQSRMAYALQDKINQQQRQLSAIQYRLMRQHPEQLLERQQHQLQQIQQRLQNQIQQRLQQHRQQLALASRSLNAISPLNTLERGYAIAINTRSGKSVRKPDDVQPGDTLDVRLAQGAIKTVVQ